MVRFTLPHRKRPGLAIGPARPGGRVIAVIGAGYRPAGGAPS